MTSTEYTVTDGAQKFDMTDPDDISRRVSNLDRKNVRELREIAGALGILRRGAKGDVISNIIISEKASAHRTKVIREKEAAMVELYGSTDWKAIQRAAEAVDSIFRDEDRRVREFQRFVGGRSLVHAVDSYGESLVKSSLKADLARAMLIAAVMGTGGRYVHGETVFGWDACKFYLENTVKEAIMDGNLGSRSTSLFSRAVGEAKESAYREFYKEMLRGW